MNVDPLIGKELGVYRIMGLVGKGGMGAVYEAEQLDLHGRRVALKVLLPKLAEQRTHRRLFEKEIEHAVAIEHPNIVATYDASYRPPHFYIAMRLVRGKDLAAVIEEQGPMTEERALRIIGQIASALQEVHDRGLIHRDVKPRNVLLWSGRDHAELSDFGIASAIRERHGSTLVGTLPYMAPEILRRGKVGPAADQYSLATLAYELLSGRLPFDMSETQERAAAHTGRPPALRQVAPRVSAQTSEAIDRALEDAPAARHPTVAAFAAAMEISRQEFELSSERRGRYAPQSEDEKPIPVADADDPTAEEIRRFEKVKRRLTGQRRRL